MERPKRNINKPSRYMTTSSDEASWRKKKRTNSITAGTIDDDIDDIRSGLEEESDNDFSDNNLSSPTHTQNSSQHTYIHTNTESYTHVEPHTNTQSHTNIQPYTNTQLDTTFSSHTNIQSSHVNIQPHENFQSHTNSQLDTNVSPHTSIQSHVNVQPHTNIQSYTNSQLDTNVSSHTSIKSYVNVQPHTNIQSYTNSQQPYTNSQLDTNVSPHTSIKSHVNVQPHTNIQSYTNSQQSYTNSQLDRNVSLHTSIQPNVQPHTNIQSHTNSPLDTNVSQHTSIKPHTNTQSHTSRQLDKTVLPHKSIPPHVNVQPHENIQSHTNNRIQTLVSNSQLDTNISSLQATSIQSHTSYPTISHNVTHTLPAYSSIHNNTPHMENNTNNSFAEFQNNSRTVSGSQQNRHTEISNRRNVQLEEKDNRRTHERLQHIEIELKRMNGILENILNHVQNRQRIPRKPNILPISSLAEMDAFENIDDNIYSDVVNYFRYIGGFNLKEAINLCFKEGLRNAITSSFTWWGREGKQRPLFNTRFIMTIYEAICNNKHFDKPTRSEFQAHMKEALRTAKEKLRSKTRGHRMQLITEIANNRNRRNLWSDERSDTEQIND